jgi:hypothetical protein
MDCFSVVENKIFKAGHLSIFRQKSICIGRLRWASSLGSSRVDFMHFPCDVDELASETLFIE